MRENAEQKNSEYGHFSRSACFNWKLIYGNKLTPTYTSIIPNMLQKFRPVTCLDIPWRINSL